MKDNRQKEQLFRNIREALIQRNEIADCDTPAAASSFFAPIDDDICVTFTKNFTRAGGTLYYCYNEADIRSRILQIQHQHGNLPIACASDNLFGFLEHLKIDNREICSTGSRPPLGASLCEALIAWQGSIVISSNLGLGVTIPALYDTTIFLAFTSQVVSNWEVANDRLKQLYHNYPDQILVANPANYACRKGQQKLFLILIEDET